MGAVSAAAWVAPVGTADASETPIADEAPSLEGSRTITLSETGQDALDAFIDRHALPDTEATRQALTVREDTFSNGETSILVGPAGIEVTTRIEPDGMIVDEYDLEAPDLDYSSLFIDESSRTADPQTAAALSHEAGVPAKSVAAQANPAQWKKVNGGCYARYDGNNLGVYTDVCAQSWWLANDGNSSLHFWGVTMRSTSGPQQQNWALTQALLRARENTAGSAPNQWFVDWSPDGDTTGACTNGYQVSAGVQVYGIGASISETVNQRCETWDMTKGPEWDVDFSLEWRGTVIADRGLAFAITTRSLESIGGTAAYTITYGVGGCVLPDC